jgi:eukaryotic-like serine/threonine-protein kinase
MDTDLLFGLQAVRLGLCEFRTLIEVALTLSREGAGDLRKELIRRAGLEPRSVAFVDQAVSTMLFAGGQEAKKTLAGKRLASAASKPPSHSTFQDLGLADTHAVFSSPSSPSTAAPPSVPMDAEPLAVTPEAPGRYAFHGGDKDSALIGRGGIGRVLVVHDRHLGRDVAVKELLGDETIRFDATADQHDPAQLSTASVGRFVREAQVTGQLEHPNIVPVYELGIRADGTLYYTMKLVRGRTLSEAIRTADGLGPRLKLLPHYADICQAVAYSHSRGVIHRDLKSENVMLGEFGETLVLDWGLAKVRGQRDPRGSELAREAHLCRAAAAGHTVDGSLVGTPAYMSPEQASGEVEQVDEQADVWALGVILYELLTGGPPFVGGSLVEVLQKIRTEAPPSPRTLDEAIPADLASVAMRALQLDRAVRYRNARELADEIQAYQVGGRVAAHDYSSWEHLRRFAAKNRAAIVAVGVIFAVIVAALVVIASSYTRERAARRHAQEATQREQEARAEEARVHRLTNYSMAQGMSEKATRLVGEHALLSTRVYAAAALLQNPATPSGPNAAPAFATAIPESADLLLDSVSLIYQTHVTAPARHRLTLQAGQPLQGVAFSPDGSRIGASGTSGRVEVWNAQTGEREAELAGHRGTAWAVAFSGDGRLLASGGQDGAVRLAPSSGGAGARVLERAHEGDVFDVAFSPEGVLATAGQDGRVRLWDASSLRPLASLEGHGGPVHALAFDGRGSLLASASRDRTVRLWDPRACRLLRALEGHGGVVRGVALSSDGALVASASYDRTLRVWDTARGTLRFVSPPLDDEILSVAFSPDGRTLASTGWDRTVRLWDTATGEQLLRVEAHAAAAWRAAFSPDGRTLASAGADRRVRLWELRPVSRALAHAEQGYLWSVRFSPDGKTLASAGADGSIHLWDLTRSARRARLAHFNDTISEIAYTLDGRLLASAGYDGRVVLWATASGKPLRALVGHRGFVRGLAFAPDGKLLATAGHDGTVRLWDVATGAPRWTVDGQGGPVRDVVFSPSGHLVASSGNDGAIRLWDPERGVVGKRLALGPKPEGVVGLEFSHDGRWLAAGGQEGTVALFEMPSGARRRVHAWHRQQIYNLRFTPDDRYLATASDDRTVAIGLPLSAQPFLRLRVSQSVVALDFSPDGRTLAVGDAKVVRFYPIDFSSLQISPRDQVRQAEQAAGLHLAGFNLMLVD